MVEGHGRPKERSSATALDGPPSAGVLSQRGCYDGCDPFGDADPEEPMKQYPLREEIRRAWKTFPLRIEGFGESPCWGADRSGSEYGRWVHHIQLLEVWEA